MRVGSRAAQQCEWYRVLGSIDNAAPGRLAAMILLGPPAAQAGMEIERERSRMSLMGISSKIDAHAQLAAAHGALRDQLAATLERTQDERELLAAVDGIAKLDAQLEQAVEALFCSEVYDVWPVRDPERIRDIQRRIGDWAAWRAGEAWRAFGERIELLAVLDRRSYYVELGTQFESRRVAYKYSASDLGRMPAAARGAVDDVWTCRMPALPIFGADLKLERAQEVQCPRCGVRGRVELQEAWGTMAYPFSTTYACNDKVGIQCQTRMGHAAAYLGVSGTPGFVSEFIDAHASIDPAPERMLEFLVDRVSPAWIERVEASVSNKLREMLANADADVRSNERITRQRLRVTWTGVTEIQYRFEGHNYLIWIPERADVIPIAVEHPLPSVDSASAPPSSAPEPQEVSPARTPGVSSPPNHHDTAMDDVPTQPARMIKPASGSTWIRSAGLWLAIFAVLVGVVMWMVNWKP
jgi:hypothetical protein